MSPEELADMSALGKRNGSHDASLELSQQLTHSNKATTPAPQLANSDDPDLLVERVRRVLAALERIPAKAPLKVESPEGALSFARGNGSWELRFQSAQERGVLPRDFFTCSLDNKAKAAKLLPELYQKLLLESSRRLVSIREAHAALDDVDRLIALDERRNLGGA
jgi:hypothetical protein